MARGVDYIYDGATWQVIGRGGGSGSGGGASAFVDLTDVPATYAGSGSKVVSVKSDASGLEFTTAAVSSFDTNFYAYLSVNQSVASGAARKIVMDTIVTDGNSEWDVANSYWLCKTSGYYGISYSAAPINTYTNYFRTLLYIDGAAKIIGQNITGVTLTTTSSIITVPNYYIASGSYVEPYVTIDVTTSAQGNSACTFLRIIRYK